jgi:hypothetical protein
MKTVRLASGLGFYGDSWEPVRAAIERGGAQYVCSDHLSELTLAILRKDQARDATAGYTRDLVPMLSALWPAAQQRGVKFVLNAGGLNPQGAAAALQAVFQAKGWAARIAVVTGDSVLERIDELRAAGEPLAHLDSGADIAQVRTRLVFANAYLGAEPIVRALAAGADIVLTGRVADAALFLAPLVHEFGWSLQPADAAGWNLLAQGLTLGHLMECSGQGSGGNFGAAQAWQRIPDLTHIGYPIAEVGADGSAIVTKVSGSGGRINFHTLRQQLLYEVHNPHAYYSPDVVLDMGTLRLDDLGADRVRVSAATGHARPAMLKLMAGYEDGWMGQSVVGFCWPDAMAKARATIASVRTQLAERKMAVDEVLTEFLGHDAFLGPHADHGDEARLNEVWLRMAIRTRDKRVADAFPRLFPWMALSGAPYMGGLHGTSASSQLLGVWPSLVPRAVVEPRVQVTLTDTAA